MSSEQAIAEALGDKAGIKPLWSFPASRWTRRLVLSAVDLCGRPYLSWDAEFTVPRLGDMDTEMAKEFFYAVSYAAAMNLHLKVLDTGQQSSYDGSNV